eukprot:Opistho-1_new@28529
MSRLSRVGSDKRSDGPPPRQTRTGVPLLDTSAAEVKAMVGSHAGYLERRSKGLIASWQRTYVVLLDGCVYYYKSADAPKATGHASLVGYTLNPAYKKGKFAFQLVPPKGVGETISLNAFDSSEQQDWVSAAEREIARAQIAAQASGLTLSAVSSVASAASPSVSRQASIKHSSSLQRQGSTGDLDAAANSALKRNPSIKTPKRPSLEEGGDVGSGEDKPYIEFDSTQAVPVASPAPPSRRSNSMPSNDEPPEPTSRLSAKRGSIAVAALGRLGVRRGSNASINEVPETSPRPTRRDEPPPVPQRPEDGSDSRRGSATDHASPSGERPKGDYIYFEDGDVGGDSSEEEDSSSKRRPFARGDSQSSLGKDGALQPHARGQAASPMPSPRPRPKQEDFAPASPSPLRKDSSSSMVRGPTPAPAAAGRKDGAYLEILDDGTPVAEPVAAAPPPAKKAAEHAPLLTKRTSAGAESFNPYENSPKPMRAAATPEPQRSQRVSVDESSNGSRPHRKSDAASSTAFPVLRELDYDTITKAFWYHGPITRELAEERILTGPVGHFLVRASLNGPDTVITVRGVDRPKHYKILWEDGLCHLGEGPRFQNPILLLRHFVTTPLPNAIGNLVLTKACHP